MQITVVCYVKTLIENNVWDLAQTNFDKSETLTREIIKVVESRDAFAFSLSQEMKNSLGYIKENINYLLQTIKVHDHVELIKNIKLNIDVIEIMIDTILNVSKVRRNETIVSNVSADLVQITEKALISQSNLMRKKDVFFQTFIDNKLPPKLWIDSSLLLQIMVNLISNTINYTQPTVIVKMYATWCSEEFDKDNLLNTINLENESIQSRNEDGFIQEIRPTLINERLNSSASDQEAFEEFTNLETLKRLKNFKSHKAFGTRGFQAIKSKPISLSSTKNWSIHLCRILFSPDQPVQQILTSKGHLKLQISYGGREIETGKINRLFELHEPDQTHRRSTPVGTSLRLWLCKQLCTMMNGDSAFSKIEQGTTFVLYIPVDNTQINRLSIQNSIINTNSNINIIPRPQGKVTALVVDDYPFNRDLHKLLLEKEEVNVIVASGGTNYFDFIMTDVQMPVMDGFTSIKKIREWERERNKKKVDIYFVSGEYFNEGDVMAKLRAHGDMSDTIGIRCLRKPIDLEVLRQFTKKYKSNR